MRRYDMKRIVFLLSMLAFWTLTDGTLGAEEPVMITHELIDGAERLVIEGKTHTPFRLVLGDEHNRYVDSGYRQENGWHVVYGYASLETSPSFYEGFLVVFDDGGVIRRESTIDFDHLEEVMDVRITDDALYVHVRQSIDNRPEGLIHRRDYLLKMEDGEDIIHEQTEKIRRMIFEENVLYFSEHYQGIFEKAYHMDHGLLEENAIFGLEDRGQYRDVLEVHSLCAHSTFEGDPFERSLRVDYPGHYTMGCGDESYTFTLHPGIEGVTLHDVTKAPAALDISGGRVWLNGALHMEGETLDRPGHYTLKVEGANDYAHTTYFTLESGLEGVEEGGVYSQMKTLFFSGTGFLNDTPISSGVTLEDAGVHTLRIVGEGDYEETVTFEIQKGASPPIKNLLRFEIILGLCGVVLTGGIVFLFLRKR